MAHSCVGNFASVVLAGFLMSISANAQPETLGTSDGLRLEFSPEGRVVGCWLDERDLPLTAPGGFAIRDYHASADFQPVRGALRRGRGRRDGL